MAMKLGGTLAVLLMTGICSAAPITYTITGNLSGTLGSVSLNNIPFTFVFRADTTNIFNDNPLLNPDLTNNISIGGNAGQFSQIVDVGVSPSNGIGGFSHPVTELGITFANPRFFDYTLASSM